MKDNKNVIWEQPWRKISNISLTVNNIKNSIRGLDLDTKFFVVELSIDKNISWERSKDKFVNLINFESYISKYQKYNLKLPYLKLDGVRNTTELVPLVTRQLKTFVKDKTPLPGV